MKSYKLTIIGLVCLVVVCLLTTSSYSRTIRGIERKDYIYNREISYEELEDIISNRASDIKAIVLDLNGTITNLFSMPDREIKNLLNKLNEKNIPIAILTTTPILAHIKLGNNFYIGNKENITDFMERYKLKPKDLVIIANDYLGADGILFENAPGALVLNVGNFSSDLPFGIISLEGKGPEATKQTLSFIHYYKFEIEQD